MALSTRSRRKGAERAAKRLGAGSVVRQYGVGHAPARMPVVAALVGVFGVAFVVALTMGLILMPGGLLLAVLASQIRPPRSLAITDSGVVLFNRSALNGSLRPLGTFPHAVFWPSHARRRGRNALITLGAETVTMRRQEYDVLATAAHAAATTASRVPQPVA